MSMTLERRYRDEEDDGGGEEGEGNERAEEEMAEGWKRIGRENKKGNLSGRGGRRGSS